MDLGATVFDDKLIIARSCINYTQSVPLELDAMVRRQLGTVALEIPNRWNETDSGHGQKKNDLFIHLQRTDSSFKNRDKMRRRKIACTCMEFFVFDFQILCSKMSYLRFVYTK